MARTDKGLEVGELAPTWDLIKADGSRISSSQFRGRPLLIFFFRGTWCPTCRNQMEEVKTHWQKIVPLAQVIGIVPENLKQVQNYATRTQMPFPLLADPERKVIQLHNVYRRFGLDGFNIAFPSTLLLDVSGIVTYCYVGESTFDRPLIIDVMVELEKLVKARV